MDTPDPIYITCEDCGEQQAVNIGGNAENGWQYECAACGHTFVSDIAPPDDGDLEEVGRVLDGEPSGLSDESSELWGNTLQDGLDDDGSDEPDAENKPFVGQLRAGTREGTSKSGNPKTIHVVESWDGESWSPLSPEFTSARQVEEVIESFRERWRDYNESVEGGDGHDDHEEMNVVEVEGEICKIPLDGEEIAVIIQLARTFWTDEEADEAMDEIREADLVKLMLDAPDDGEESGDESGDGEESDDDAGESGEIDAADQPFVSLDLFKRLLNVIEGEQLRTLVRRQRLIGQWIGDGRNRSKEAAFNDMTREFDELNAWILAEVSEVKKEAGLESE